MRIAPRGSKPALTRGDPLALLLWAGLVLAGLGIVLAQVASLVPETAWKVEAQSSTVPLPPPPSPGTVPNPPTTSTVPQPTGTAPLPPGPTVPPPPASSTVPLPPSSTPALEQTPAARSPLLPLGLDLSQMRLPAGLRLVDQSGVVLPRSGDQIRIENGEAGGRQAILPVVLVAGQGLAAFHDPDTGIAWRPSGPGGLLSFSPPRDETRQSLTLRLGPFASDGRAATAPIMGSEFSLGPVETNGGSAAGTVRIAGSLGAEVGEFHLGLQSLSTDDVRPLLERAARDAGRRLADVAFTVHVAAEGAPGVSSAMVEMTVKAGWADIWAPENIRIIRVAGGDGQVLQTVLAQGPDGALVFRAASPNGFSTFALAAVSPDQPGQTAVSPGRGFPWLIVVLGGFAVFALAAGTGLLARSR